MIDLNPYIPPDKQKKIGPVLMSDRAAGEIIAALRGAGASDSPEVFAPCVAATVTQFLDSAYFARSDWFRRQPVHRTMTLQVADVTPVMHLLKTKHGHMVVACDEAPLSENYFEERVVEETKVEMGVL